MTVTVVEARPVGEAVQSAAAGGRLQVQLVNPGWGSSGFYSAAVLEAAGKGRVFQAGTQMFADHPGETERYDRPERSVKDLAAVLTEDARWDEGAQALVAEAQVFATYREMFTDPALASAIGVSIRAQALVEHGEAEGRSGTIITELVAAESVDFVTKAGRGGRILQVLESAREHATDLTRDQALARVAEARNIGHWIESRLHLSLTQLADEMFGDGRLTREERIGLSGAVGDGLTAFTAALEQAAPQLYTRDLWDEPTALVAAATESVPVTPAGQSTTTQESREDTMPQIEEARLRQLEADAGRVQTLESERDAATTDAQTVRAELAEARTALNTATAARVVREAADAARVDLDQWQVAGLTAAPPVAENGTVDEAALRTRADAAVTAIAERAGAGTVRGFGGGTPAGDELTESALDETVAGAFGRQIRKA